ncbi:hypothetical protein BZG36_05218 [Bifiguratus adelaidae]|uniref:Uncharacterized protein n=1 Tax=Bifiguratus adelaidae TaxID=1938954 RepID=A0A261XWU5_9FUNG|nr:hypothetical protein BZG36_05218 [Bifiguratus adelaidae]
MLLSLEDLIGFKEICGPIVEAASNDSAIPATKTNGGHPRYSHITQWTLEDLLHYIRTWEYTMVAQNQDNHDPVAPLQKLLEEAWSADANTPKDVRWEFRLRLAKKSADT